MGNGRTKRFGTQNYLYTWGVLCIFPPKYANFCPCLCYYMKDSFAI